MSLFSGHYSHGSFMEECGYPSTSGLSGEQQFTPVGYFPNDRYPSEQYQSGATYASPQDASLWYQGSQASGTTPELFHISQEADFSEAPDFTQAIDSSQVRGFSQSLDFSQASNFSPTPDQGPPCRQRSSSSRKSKTTKWHELPPQASTEAEEKRLRAVKGWLYREKRKEMEQQVQQDLADVTAQNAQLRSERDMRKTACAEMERVLKEATQRHGERGYSVSWS